MGETFQAINPVNEEVLALERKATKVDLPEAVKVARKVFARMVSVQDQPTSAGALSAGQR
jgi:acyl-CoA reductase-like NAD-dependent aldehyde dehydrogenase